jgi:Fur family transcriptional regulator, iron response regulator
LVFGRPCITIMTEINATAASNSLETAHGPDTDSACARERPSLRDHEAMLRDVGLRPTRQRVALAKLLYAHGDRHVTAEMLYAEATRQHLPVSLATIYNTLNQFAKVGLLREVGVDGFITYFDTRTSDHHHFFMEGENEIRDIPTTDIRIGKMAEIPEGYEIARVDLMIRLKRKR